MQKARVLRTRSAARYIGISESTLEKMRARGEGPRAIRLGSRAVGYDQADLDAWIESQRRKNKTATAE